MVKKATFTNGNILITTKQRKKFVFECSECSISTILKQDHIFALWKKVLFGQHRTVVSLPSS